MATLGEAVYRVGGGIGGWLIVFAWALVTAVMPRATCEPGDDVIWRSTLIFGVLAAIAAVLTSAGLRQRSHLRWFAAAAAPLVAWDVYWILPTLFDTTFGVQSMCAASSLEPTSWERAWPIVQLIAGAIAGVQVVRYWQPTKG